MFRLAVGFLIGVLFGATFCTPARAHDWYPPSCCGGHDCAPVKAWFTDDEVWEFTYKDGKTYKVPKAVIQDDETNKEPFQAHACVIDGSYDEGGNYIEPYVRCFWLKGAGS